MATALEQVEANARSIEAARVRINDASKVVAASALTVAEKDAVHTALARAGGILQGQQASDDSWVTANTPPEPATPPPAALPDLVIEALSMSPASPQAGDSVSFSVVVKNIGVGATPDGIVIGVGFVVDGSEVSWSDTDSASLAPGEAVSLFSDSTKLWVAAAGSHTVVANVNDIKRFQESDFNNNTASLAFSVASVVTPTPAPTPTKLGYTFGINGHDLRWGYLDPTYTPALVTGCGAKVYRNDILVVPGSTQGADGTPGTFGSSQCTAAVKAWADALRAAGVQPMLVCTWGGSSNAAAPGLPETQTVVAGLKALCAAVPGLWIEWGNELGYSDPTSARDPSGYVAQFAAVVAAVHGTDSTAKIGPCPVANINPGSGGWKLAKSWFDNGLASVPYDFFPFHDYPWPTAEPPAYLWTSHGSPGGYSAETLIPVFTSQVTAWGNKAPYWLTEFGWQSVDTSATPNMTEDLQSQYVVAFMEGIASYGLEVVLAYTLGDDSQSYGFMNSDKTVKKPVYSAVAQALEA